MFLSGEIFIVIAILFLYKLLDRLIRIPKISKPSGRMNNILVTGCDTGFGNVFAKRMASKGFTVFAACLTEDGKASLSQHSPGLLKPLLMNVTDVTSIRKGYEYVCSQLGPKEGLWAIVNNAGIAGTSSPFEWLKKEHFTEVMDVNVYGMLEVTKQFLPLVKKTHGRIVNTCSIVGRFTLPCSAPYVMSKYAAEALSDGIRREMYPFGLSLHIIEPGFFFTELLDSNKVISCFTRCWEQQTQEIKDEYGPAYLKGAADTITKTLPMTGSSNLSLVVDCYEHAVTARYPRGRYMPGYDSRFLYWPLSFAPEWLSDSLLYWASRLTLPLPAGVKKYKI